MLAVALQLVSFWPPSFTGAAGLISRYTFCAGYGFPVVLNATATTARVMMVLGMSNLESLEPSSAGEQRTQSM